MNKQKSIVDYLKTKDIPSDFNSRTILAELLGIKPYTGSCMDNECLLLQLKNKKKKLIKLIITKHNKNKKTMNTQDKKEINFYHNEKLTVSITPDKTRVYFKVEGLGTFAMPTDAAMTLSNELKELMALTGQ